MSERRSAVKWHVLAGVLAAMGIAAVSWAGWARTSVTRSRQEYANKLHQTIAQLEKVREARIIRDTASLSAQDDRLSTELFINRLIFARYSELCHSNVPLLVGAGGLVLLAGGVLSLLRGRRIAKARLATSPLPASPVAPIGAAATIARASLLTLTLGLLAAGSGCKSQTSQATPPAPAAQMATTAPDNAATRTEAGHSTTSAAVNPNRDSKALIAFQLGTGLYKVAFLRLEDNSTARAASLLTTLQGGAKCLGVTVPPLPELTGNRLKDLESAIDYAVNDGGANVAMQLRDRHSAESDRLVPMLELGVKFQSAIFGYSPDGKGLLSGSKAAETLEDRALRTQLPEKLWKPLVDSLRANRPESEVDQEAKKMREAIFAYLFEPHSKPATSAMTRDTPASVSRVAIFRSGNSCPVKLPDPANHGVERNVRSERFTWS